MPRPLRTLVTGVTGFAGLHLADALLAAGGYELHGLARRARWPAAGRHLADCVALTACDLCDGAAVEAALRRIRPERIFHLAGYAFTRRSLAEPEAAWAGNLGATRCLYEAVARGGGRPRILFVGSGLVYGGGAGPERPRDELCLLQPDSPYAASKAAADLASFQYGCHPGLEIVRARPFNHIGPGQGAGFAVADFARQLVAIERGHQPAVLNTGHLGARRDLTDVRDVAAAYVLLMERGRGGEAYNVSRGGAVAIGEVLERLLALSGLPVQVCPRADPAGAAEPQALCGDSGKLRHETSWEPRYSLEETLADTLAYWRAQPPGAAAGAA
jgi:GDP-4-dehydro-6-deoxy-D-mannose reductase